MSIQMTISVSIGINQLNEILNADHKKRRGGTWPPNVFGHDHKKRRGCIPCELFAWDDKNYFEGKCDEVIEQLKRWNSEDYYELRRLGCPKCGSFRIIGNVPRDRGVISSYRCLDCGYRWKRK